jgi:hypothetical protein
MQNDLDKHWFFEQLAKEAFVIFSVAWGSLFLLELLKPGLVSNYLSLTHAALPLFFLGVLWLVLLPDQEVTHTMVERELPVKSLCVISFFIVLVLFLLLQTSLPLTLLIIFATLAGLWGGALAFVSQ